MSLLLHQIAEMLEDHGLGTVGTDIKVGEVPADPANVLWLVPSVSFDPDMYLVTQDLAFEIWGRNQSTKTGQDKMDSVVRFLHRQHHLTLGDYYVYLILATGNVEDLDRDTERRKLHKVNFRAIYWDMRTVS